MKRISQKKLILIFQVLGVFIVYAAILFFLSHHIPNAPKLIHRVERLYGKYGYDLIFLGALLEGTFLVGFYVPGSFIVLLGAVLARAGIVSFPLVVLFGTLGLVTGYVLNYCLGRFGWFHILKGFGFNHQIKIAEEKLMKSQDKTLFWGYIMPSSASFLSTAAGVLKINFKKFFIQSLFTQLFWSLLWGGLAYIFGIRFVEAFIAYFGFVAIAGFLLFFVKRIRWN